RQSARRGQGAAPRVRRTALRQRPHNRAGANVERLQHSLRLWIGGRALRAAQVRLAGLPFSSVALRVDAAFFERLHVVETGRGVKSRPERLARAILTRDELR